MSLTGTQDFARAIEPFVASIGGSQTFARALGASSDTISLILDGAPTGLVGVLTITIYPAVAGPPYLPTTTQGIVEYPAGTGRYVATVVRPPVGFYFIVWSDGVTTSEPIELNVFISNRWDMTPSPDRWLIAA